MMKLRKRRCGLARGAGEKRTIYERGQGQVDGESTRRLENKSRTGAYTR